MSVCVSTMPSAPSCAPPATAVLMASACAARAVARASAWAAAVTLSLHLVKGQRGRRHGCVQLHAPPGRHHPARSASGKSPSASLSAARAEGRCNRRSRHCRRHRRHNRWWQGSCPVRAPAPPAWRRRPADRRSPRPCRRWRRARPSVCTSSARSARACFERGFLRGQHRVHAKQRRADVRGQGADHAGFGQGKDRIARSAQIGFRHIAQVDVVQGQLAFGNQRLKGFARIQPGLGGSGIGVGGKDQPFDQAFFGDDVIRRSAPDRSSSAASSSTGMSLAMVSGSRAA